MVSGVSTVVLSAMMAGFVAILATVVIERRGGALGTVVTIPTTILPASVGIWSEAVDEVAFAASMSVVPVGMGLNVLFLMMWRFLPRYVEGRGRPGRQVLVVALVSVGAWAVTAALTVMVLDHIPDHLLAWTGISITLLAILLGVLGVLRSPPAPKGGSPVTLGTLLARGVAAALAIGASVWIASLGLPIISGMVSVFPAIFLTTMVSLWLAQGSAVPVGATGPMMLGASSVSIHALICIPLFGALGPVIGTIVAWSIAVFGFSLPAGLWVWHRLGGASAEATVNGA